MDEHGFPLVGPGIDYTKVQAIHQKRTLAFLNHFVTHTARFLNRFSCVCEEKLEDLSVRIQRLETSMNILESKLSSIPGLENVTVTSSPAAAATEQPAVTPSSTEQQPAPQEEAPAPAAEPEPEKPKMTVSQDPRYQKYFKMVQVGVPAAALRGKMLAEGLDPNLLDTPDAPAPEGALGKDSDSDSSGDEPDSDDFDD